MIIIYKSSRIKRIFEWAIVLILILSSFSLELKAQQNFHSGGQNFTEYIVRYNPVKIFQDRKGYVWVGTHNGIAKWDGLTFEWFKDNLTNIEGFKGRFITDIYEDKNDIIWVLTKEGFVNYYSPYSNIFHQIEDVSSALELINPNSIIEIGDDLFVSDASNLYRVKYSKDQYQLQNLNIDIETNSIIEMSYFNDEEIFIHGNELLKLTVNEGSFELTQVLKERIIALDKNENGSFIAISEDEIYTLDLRNKESLIINQTHSDKQLSCLFSDVNDQLWLGHSSGLSRYQIESSGKLKEINFYPMQDVIDIFKTNSGDFLFAGLYNSVLKLNWNFNQYNYISLPVEYENSYIFKFYEDLKGNIWIGAKDGAFLYTPSSGKTIKLGDKQDSLNNAMVYSISEDGNGNIWVGTTLGMRFYDPKLKKFIIFENQNELRTRKLMMGWGLKLLNDTSLFFISNNKLFQHLPSSNEVKGFKNIKNVEHFYLDRKKRFWLFESNNTLHEYALNGDSLTFKRTALKDKLKGRVINFITEDKNGKLWIGWQFGVVVFDPIENKIVKHLTTQNGLFEDDVFEIIADDNGYMWVKQARFGSICFEPDSFKVIAYTPKWLRRPGTPDFACVGFKSRSGDLFTDGNGGFYIFNPVKTIKNAVPPKLNLESIKVNGKVKKDINLKDLDYDENNIEIEFCGIHFDNPERVKFAYKLEGYNKDWNYIENQKIVRFASLPKGNYNFKLKASNADGLWSEPQELSSFNINPPIWLSNFAYVLYAIVILIIVISIYNFQLKRRLAISESNKLKEIDILKTKFFTNITHEFRTPLTVILGLSKELKNEGEIPNQIYRNGQRLLNLINQILDLSKMDDGKLTLNNKQIDVMYFSKYIVSSFKSLAESKKMTIDLDQNPIQLEMDLDEEKFQVILVNLISNAIKFSPGESKIHISLIRKSNNLFISVKDSGPGIPEDELENVFDRFYQIQNSKAKIGSGVGLSLAKELVKLMGGSIGVRNTEEGGALFEIVLPITQSAKAIDKINLGESLSYAQLNDSDEIIENINSDNEKPIVLIVEDEPDVRSYIVKCLGSSFNLILAENGVIGKEKALEFVPDLIISDVMMPEKDGLELTAELKTDIRTSHIPIIILSAKASLTSRLDGLKRGAEVYLAKPFDKEELLLQIKNLFTLQTKIQSFFKEINNKELPVEVEAEEHHFIIKLKALIEENLDDNQFGLEKLCSSLAMSRTQLHRKLVALTGLSATKFINSYKLSKACEMLLEDRLNISEIAYSLGYKDPNYFTRIFQNTYGKSPTEFKRVKQN